MNLHEYQARQLLIESGLPVPRGEVAETPEQARGIACRLGMPTVVKAQVLVGGRGKAGGVRLAATPEEAAERAREILGTRIGGIAVRKVLVAEAVRVVREFYLAAVIDRTQRVVAMMATAEGGVDVEEVARTAPDKVLRVDVDPFLGLADFQARGLAFDLGLEHDEARAFARIVGGVYATLIRCDASLVEVNPVAIAEDGSLQCLDAKIVLDDNALFRHPDLVGLRESEEESPEEAQARAAGLSYVRLDGDIGCVVNGAGLAMATMDLVKLYGGAPANFLDIGGGARAERVSAALRLVVADPAVKAVLLNIFGGITRCDEVARGIVGALRELALGVPVVVRLAGTSEEEGRRILAEAGLVATSGMDEAARAAVVAAQAARPPGSRP